MGVNGEALQLLTVYNFFFAMSHTRICIRYYKSRENPYQVLQVMCMRLVQLQVLYNMLEVCGHKAL